MPGRFADQVNTAIERGSAVQMIDMQAAWDSLPPGDQAIIAECRGPLGQLARHISGDIIGILAAAPNAIGFSALVITTRQLIEMTTAGAVDSYDFSDLSAVQAVGGKQPRFSRRNEAIFLRVILRTGSVQTYPLFGEHAYNAATSLAFEDAFHAYRLGGGSPSGTVAEARLATPGLTEPSRDLDAGAGEHAALPQAANEFEHSAFRVDRLEQYGQRAESAASPRRFLRKRWIAVAALAVVIALWLAGHRAPPSSSSAQTPLATSTSTAPERVPAEDRSARVQPSASAPLPTRRDVVPPGPKKLGSTVSTGHFTIQALHVRSSAVGYEVLAVVCIRRLPSESGPRVRVSIDPWVVVAGGKDVAAEAGGTYKTVRLTVGACNRGWIRFPTNGANVTQIVYRNSLGERATW